MADENTLAGRLKSFGRLVEIQCSPGNWNYDPYMHGMANGMLLAQAMMRGEEVSYLDAPNEWLADKPGVSEVVSEG